MGKTAIVDCPRLLSMLWWTCIFFQYHDHRQKIYSNQSTTLLDLPLRPIPHWHHCRSVITLFLDRTFSAADSDYLTFRSLLFATSQSSALWHQRCIWLWNRQTQCKKTALWTVVGTSPTTTSFASHIHDHHSLFATLTLSTVLGHRHAGTLFMLKHLLLSAPNQSKNQTDIR